MISSISKPLILLIGPNDFNYKYLSKLLLANGFDTMWATCVSEAIQKLVEHLPQIIICNNQLKDYNAFQVYNIFENSILKNATPFVVVMEDENFDSIELGLELGIDNFIFTPFKDEVILKKIKNLLTKVGEQKASAIEQLQKLFDDSPIGILILADNYIEKINKAFFKLVGIKETKLDKKRLQDFFDTEERVHDKEEVEKCLKGLVDKCCVKALKVKKRNVYVDMHVSHYGNFVKNRVIIQFIVTKNNEVRRNENRFSLSTFNGNNGRQLGMSYALTDREIEIIKLSAQGYQIKEIANELKISKRTVEKHRSNLMQKTNTNNIIEAIAKVCGIQEYV